MSQIFKARNKSYKKGMVSKDKLYKHLMNDGYLPDSWVLPPFIEVKEKSTTRTGDGSTREPLFLFAPKSKLKWRAFGFLHPNNYQNVCEVLKTKQYSDSLLKLAQSSKIFSYSLPAPYKTSTGSAKKQIERWNDLQEDLLLHSDQYEYLLILDITNCYHSMYTHSIEWAFESVGNKRIGEKLDKAIRGGMKNRTHGLPVGPAVTHQIAEAVLLKIDRLIEEETGIKDFLGGRFRDNYYILCKKKQDAEILLKDITKVLRKYHLDFNSDKTEILKTQEHFDSFWRIDFNTILLTLGIEDNDSVKKIPIRNIEAFIGLSLRLSQKHNNEKAVPERVLDILENIEPERDLYPKYFSLIQRMYHIRTQSLPKVLSTLFSLAEKNDYCSKRFNNFLIARLLLAYQAEDNFELMWIIYFLAVRKVKNTKVTSCLTKIKNIDDNFLKTMCLYYDGLVNGASLSRIDVFSKLWTANTNTSNLEAKFKIISNPVEIIETLKIKFGY